MAKYRKKPVVIEAVQFKGFDKESHRVDLTGMPDWLINRFGREILFFDERDTLTIKTLEGDMKCLIGDYIIKGVQGEVYPCKPDIFEMTYELVEDEH